MRRGGAARLAALTVAMAAVWLPVAAEQPSAAAGRSGVAAFGRLLFFDVNLSRRRTQSCASCHDPARAFTDPRPGAVSVGDDGVSAGRRNAPTLTYAFLTPGFATLGPQSWHGGFFLDGRAATLAAQAREPFTNPLEMGLADPAAVVGRVLANRRHRSLLTTLHPDVALDDVPAVYGAITAALAVFQSTAAFATFDSKYDRWLAGEYDMTADEELGRNLFFSELTNCGSCHLRTPTAFERGEPFTNHRYHNIGVPPQAEVLARHGTDRGLAENAGAPGPGRAGRFKVPTLRNVAVTAPYMHNGVFRDLYTAVHFYNRYLVRGGTAELNPETGERWRPAETAENVQLDLLARGQPLDDHRIRVLIAFLETLTDRRYEPLLNAGAGS